MANETWIGFGGSGTFGAQGNTNTNGLHGASINSVAVANEARVQTSVKAGTLSMLRAYVSAVNDANDTTTFAARINGVASAVTVTTGAGATGEFEDTTHSAAVVDGDLVTMSATGSSAPYSSTSKGFMSLVYAATAAMTVFWGCNGGPNVTLTGTADRYSLLMGGSIATATTTEAEVQTKARALGTLSNFRIYVVSNTKAGNLIATVRKNAADATQTVTVGSTATGAFEDVTHSDSVTDGSEWDVVYRTGVTGTTAISSVQAVFVSSAAQFDQTMGLDPSNTNGATATRYIQTGGTPTSTIESTEALAQGRIRFATTTSRMRLNVIANQLANTITWSLRINGATVNQTASSGSGTTGYFEDVTHTDAVASGDLLDYIVAAASSASTKTHAMLTFGVVASAGTGTGAVGTITLSAPSGAAEVSATAAGDVGTITLSAPTGTAGVGVTGVGDVGTITLSAPTGSAVAGAQEKVAKLVAYSAQGGADDASVVAKLTGYSAEGAADDSIACSKLVAYAAFGPPLPPRRANVRVSMHA